MTCASREKESAVCSAMQYCYLMVLFVFIAVKANNIFLVAWVECYHMTVVDPQLSLTAP